MKRGSVDREKVTLSLPADLVRYADKRASELATSRSQVIGEAVAQRRAQEEEELAREGYAFFAHEAETFAAVSARAVAEAFGDAG